MEKGFCLFYRETLALQFFYDIVKLCVYFYLVMILGDDTMLIKEWQDMIDLLNHEDVIILATSLNVSIPGFSNLSRVPKPLRGRIVQLIKKRVNRRRSASEIKRIFGEKNNPEYDFNDIKDKVANIGYNRYSVMKMLILYKIFKPNDDSSVADEIFNNCFYQQDIEFTDEERKGIIPADPKTEELSLPPSEESVAEIQAEVQEEAKEAVEAVIDNDDDEQVKIDVPSDNVTVVKQEEKVNKKYVKIEKENEELKKKLENVSKDFKEKKKRISDLEKQVREQLQIAKEKDKEVEAIRQEKISLQQKIDELMEANKALREEIKYAQYPGVMIWSEEEDEYAGIKNIRKIVAVPSDDEDRVRIIEAIKKYKIKEIWYVKSGHSFGESRRMKELVREQGIALVDKRLWEVK